MNYCKPKGIMNHEHWPVLQIACIISLCDDVRLGEQSLQAKSVSAELPKEGDVNSDC
jgi:hypothetical protein